MLPNRRGLVWVILKEWIIHSRVQCLGDKRNFSVRPWSKDEQPFRRCWSTVRAKLSIRTCSTWWTSKKVWHQSPSPYSIPFLQFCLSECSLLCVLRVSETKSLLRDWSRGSREGEGIWGFWSELPAAKTREFRGKFRLVTVWVLHCFLFWAPPTSSSPSKQGQS